MSSDRKGDKHSPDVVMFMRRLREDERGNALMMAAAAMIPLVGIIGCGVDISRAYVVKTRLQQACDAGVLGGRKVMTSSGVDAAVTAAVQKFVNYDFPQQTMETASFAVAPTAGANNSVNLTLQTTVPTSLMRVLGVNSLPISTSCTARQDFVNTDVVLVLDNTLSMNCVPSDSATTYCPTEKSGAKIQALRAAVTSFYNALKPAQTTLESQGLRLRYGIVPYSMTVNVGNLLRSTNSSWVNATSTYRNCTSPGNPSPSSGNSCTTASAPYTPTRTTAFWSSWGGCIEERQTITSITTSSGYTPASSAYDLDLSTVPSGATTSWNAYDPASQGAKTNLAGLGYACPKAVQQIQAVPDVATLNTYTNSLVAGGYTYLDLGMIWGGRLLAPNGLWASNNPSTYNGFPVNRDLILMTDGAIDPDIDAYTAYGTERFDKRVTGNGTTSSQDNSHLQRFRMMCNAVKSMNVNVWVIAFGASSGTGLSSELINCASNSSQAFKAANQADLVAQFTQIGQTIGALRLSQ